MDATGAGSGDAAAEPAGEFGIAASGERRRLLVAHLDEADPVLVFAEGFDDAVDPIAGDAEHGVDAPIHDGFNENIAGGLGHGRDPCKRAAALARAAAAAVVGGPRLTRPLSA